MPAEERSKMSARVAILTGGRDKPYALGLAGALSAKGLSFDFIGSDEVTSPDLLSDPQVRFLNLREQGPSRSILWKTLRTLLYYVRLVWYAATSKAAIFHILWTNKVEWFDRTILLSYYRLLRKRIVLTAHNVNAGRRDGNDSWLNRSTLRIQYALAQHVFVHTETMRQQLIAEFGVAQTKVSVVPFGINNSIRSTTLSCLEARRQLRLSQNNKVLLFFGNIAPYKGLEFLIEALATLCKESDDYRLIIAGRPKGSEAYWHSIQEQLIAQDLVEKVMQRIEFIPDDEAEVFFKAADVLILPYKYIFQSGVLFLGYAFGLPAIVADVGSLAGEVVEGRTGFVFKGGNPLDLSHVVRRYFESELYRDRADYRIRIKDHANEMYSWSKVAAITTDVYARVLSACD